MIANENESSDSSSDDDSSEDMFEVHGFLQNILVDSADETSSKTNLLIAPSASASSILERSRFAERAEEIIAKVNKYAVDLEANGIGFTRGALIKRLQNLVSKSVKNFNGDVEVKPMFHQFRAFFLTNLWFLQLTLPGNKTQKFALRYRDEFEA